jgi:asparagine synthase (glutamine-hydrolysing)
MCGIAGIAATGGFPPGTIERVVAMRDVLTHRGPDEAGLHADEHAILGHRRLSIVDLKTGAQPMGNEDGRIQIVFNGEIYNHALVRRELEARGHQYRTTSDTETIVHAYEEWGDACVQRLRGMFAFAIWDAPKRRLLLTRDRLGIKPLYWTRRGDALLFGSEIKALFASGVVEPRARLDAIPELLGTRFVTGPDTLFEGIHALLPGHQLVFEGGALRIDAYWDLPTAADAGAEPAVKSRDGDVVERFRELFEESVQLRLMSDVPLGMFLSGGLDSSAIAAVMARLIDRPLQTFSVAFRERAFNELSYAREVAGAIGAESHEVVVGDRDFFDALPRLVWHEDEPIAHPSSVPLYFVSALARNHVKVVLTGEGSDELLAGYGKYVRTAWNWRAADIYERLPLALRSAVARGLSRAPASIQRYSKRSFLTIPHVPEAMFFDNFAGVRLADQQELLTESLREMATLDSAYGGAAAHFRNSRGTLLDRLLYADAKAYLVELLMKQDQMSMATSIESRVPFLDHKLVEFVARLPDRWKASGFQTKRILREAMKGMLPESILNRPKMGFPVPFGRWTRGSWNGVARDVLLDRRSRERGLVDAPAVDRLLTLHASGATDGGDRIWSLLNLEIWYRTFIDGGGIQSLPVPAAEQRRGSPETTTDAHSVAQV